VHGYSLGFPNVNNKLGFFKVGFSVCVCVCVPRLWLNTCIDSLSPHDLRCFGVSFLSTQFHSSAVSNLAEYVFTLFIDLIFCSTGT